MWTTHQNSDATIFWLEADGHRYAPDGVVRYWYFRLDAELAADALNEYGQVLEPKMKRKRLHSGTLSYWKYRRLLEQ